jgi:16S rRNA (guanine966-N2)-methyltransferase
MRIIGGEKKGKRILVPKKGVRPTKGIVREAVVQVIHDKIKSARILDIFAGSGALGLEALSRGADQCVFIERHPAILQKNIDNIVPNKKTSVIRSDFARALKRLRGHHFSIIFLDPPYAKNYVERTIALIIANSLLERHGVVVIEHDPEERFFLPEEYEIFRHRSYGDTAVTFMRQKEIS